MEAMKVVLIFIALLVVSVVCGGLVGSFFDWRGEKNAEAEIKKHDEYAARRIHEKT